MKNSAFKKIFSVIKTDLFVQVVVSVLTTILLTGEPYLEAELINTIVYTKKMSQFFWFVCILVIVMILQLFLSYFSSKIQYYTKNVKEVGIVSKLISKIYHLQSDDEQIQDSTYLHSRINNDVNEIANFILGVFPTFISSILTLMLISLFLVFLDYRIFVVVAVFFLLYALIYFLIKQKLYSASKLVKETYDKLFSVRNNIFINYLQIKAKEVLNTEIMRMNRSADKMFTAMKYDFRWNYIFSLVKIMVTLLFQIFFFLIGGLLVLEGKWLIGTFMITFQYFSNMLNSINSIFIIASEYQNYKVAKYRTNKILKKSNEQIGEKSFKEVKSIELRDFNLKLDNNKLYNKNLNFIFKTGKVYGIEGPNGVGKTSLILAIIGLKRDFLGKIKINSENISNIDLQEFRKNNISIMLQHEIPESITVNEYLQTYLTEKQINELLLSLKLKDSFFSSQFSIEEKLNKKMTELSGGELQLIYFFTTIVKPNTSVLILDEPFSNVASKFVPHLMNIINRISEEGKIIFLISHDKYCLTNIEQVKLEKA